MTRALSPSPKALGKHNIILAEAVYLAVRIFPCSDPDRRVSRPAPQTLYSHKSASSDTALRDMAWITGNYDARQTRHRVILVESSSISKTRVLCRPNSEARLWDKCSTALVAGFCPNASYTSLRLHQMMSRAPRVETKLIALHVLSV
jgi:hypothetical protein